MTLRLAAIATLAWASLQSPATAQEAPPADELIEAYVEAIGGRAAHTSPESIRTTGVIEMPAMGMQGRFEVLQLAPDRMLTRVTLPGVGEILTGFDGEVGWRVDPLVGPALMQGAELAQTRDRSNMLAILRDASIVRERETLELAESDGQPCWRVRLVWASGTESHDCYSRETGLLIESEDPQATQMGEMEVTTRFSDYEEFGSMMLPTRLVQTAVGQVQEMTVREIAVDDVDASELTPPPAIRTLLESAGN